MTEEGKKASAGEELARAREELSAAEHLLSVGIARVAEGDQVEEAGDVPPPAAPYRPGDAQRDRQGIVTAGQRGLQPGERVALTPVTP